MDTKNRFHSPGTYWIIRAEHLVLLALCAGLMLIHAAEVNWWRGIAAFASIDLVGYLPGAIAFRRSRHGNGRVNPWYHHAYNLAHTYLVSGAGVAVWAYCTGGFEWAMLAVPLHLSGDRGLFGNILKPVALSFEPADHSDETVLRVLGRTTSGPPEHANGAARNEVEKRVPRGVLSEVLQHPSGYLALSERNQAFVLDGVPGFISYRRQGKHLWISGGVHARPEHAGALLDRFLEFSAREGCRAGAIQVRRSQVELFAARGFNVNQFGTTYAVALKDYSYRGTQKLQLRNKINRARKLGLRVVELGREVPRDPTWFAHVQEISARWLEAKGKKELDFMIGELGTLEDADRRIFLVLDGDQKPIAFITYVPVWDQERPGYLHDLTRRIPEAPQGTMELCNAEAIERFKAESVAHLHFGFTPFITDDEEGKPASRLIARLIRLLRKYGKTVYPAEQQAAYKRKWGTDLIEREYIAFQRFTPRTLLDLLVLTKSI